MKGKFGNLGISKGMPFNALQRCMKTQTLNFPDGAYTEVDMCVCVCV